MRANNYWYDARNQLTNVRDDAGATIMGLAWDAQGNLATRNGQSYRFDLGNRLREVVGVEIYRYDAQGRRVTATDGSGQRTRSFYGASGQLLYETRRGQTAANHIYLGNRLLATRKGTAVTWRHVDVLGSPVATTNASGAVVERQQYEPYGAALGGATDGVGYTGHVMDEVTGLAYMQQRYYDPQIGRFLSVDPVTAYEDSVGMFNRYKYGSNNPYKFIDPDGEAESPAWMRGLIPGQATWDQATSEFEQGNYGRSAAFAGAALTEGAIGVVTLGQSQRIAAPTKATIAAAEAGSIRAINAVRGTNNCVNCVVATDATLAGRSASAMPGGPAPISVLERHFNSQFGPRTNVQGITEAMTDGGAGARGVVFGSRGERQVGHVFNVVNQNGTVRFLDGQTGRAASTSGYEGFQLLRTSP